MKIVAKTLITFLLLQFSFDLKADDLSKERLDQWKLLTAPLNNEIWGLQNYSEDEKEEKIYLKCNDENIIKNEKNIEDNLKSQNFCTKMCHNFYLTILVKKLFQSPQGSL